MKNYNCIVVLGATASGKTRLACELAYRLNGEIISADSRQVYKHLNIGTGKDLEEYEINGKKISYHLIDIIEPSEQFYLHQFIEKLNSAFNDIVARQKLPIICGGTGLYLDALRKDFSFTQIKEDKNLRKELESCSKEELLAHLKKYPENFIEHVDTNSKKRIIRGIEVAEFKATNCTNDTNYSFRENSCNSWQKYKPYYIGISTDTDTRKQLISERLKKRLNKGLIEEVQNLLQKGISHERLELLGLEYKFVSRYLQHTLSKEELFTQLQTAIFQFSKRQLTWFRKMEKEGVKIHWVERDVDVSELAKTLQGK